MPFIWFSPKEAPITLSPQLVTPEEIFLDFSAILQSLKTAE